jgi:hypothetical protein
MIYTTNSIESELLRIVFRDNPAVSPWFHCFARSIEEVICPKHREHSLRAMQERSLPPWADNLCPSKRREHLYSVLRFSLLRER